MPDRLRFVANFFSCIPIFRPIHTLPVLSPLSYPLPYRISHRPSIPKDLHKKLSYRGQNAPSTIKTHERNTISEHYTVVICTPVWTGRTHNVLDLSLRPSVRLSVYLFVRLLPTCERYTSKTNEPIPNSNWHKSSPGARE